MFHTVKMLSRPNNLIKTIPNNLSAREVHNNGRFKGKVAIVTASTEGIGFAIAKRLGSEGANVVISSRKAKNVENAVKSLRDEGITVEGVVCHVANAEQRKNLFDVTKSKFGGLDILVSNAAVNPAVSPILEPLGPYSVSKTTLLGLTKAMANEIVHDNIRVNCVAPGIVATKFASAITSSEAGKDKSLSIVPMKRFGKPSEIAGAVAFLASDDASYITGETIVTAGGAYAHL